MVMETPDLVRYAVCDFLRFKNGAAPPTPDVQSKIEHMIASHSCFRDDVPEGGMMVVAPHSTRQTAARSWLGSGGHTGRGGGSAGRYNIATRHGGGHYGARAPAAPPRSIIAKDHLSEIRSCLNKMSSTNFDVLAPRVIKTCMAGTASLTDTIGLVIDKSGGEGQYVRLYVQLLLMLQAAHPSSDAVSAELQLQLSSFCAGLKRTLNGLTDVGCEEDYDAFCREKKQRTAALNINHVFLGLVSSRAFGASWDLLKHFTFLADTLQQDCLSHAFRAELVIQMLLDTMHAARPLEAPKLCNILRGVISQHGLPDLLNKRTLFMLMDAHVIPAFEATAVSPIQPRPEQQKQKQQRRKFYGHNQSTGP